MDDKNREILIVIVVVMMIVISSDNIIISLSIHSSILTLIKEGWEDQWPPIINLFQKEKRRNDRRKRRESIERDQVSFFCLVLSIFVKQNKEGEKKKRR